MHHSSLLFFSSCSGHHLNVHSFPTRRSSDLCDRLMLMVGLSFLKRLFVSSHLSEVIYVWCYCWRYCFKHKSPHRSEERFSRNAETDLVCRLLLEKKKTIHLLNVSTIMRAMEG